MAIASKGAALMAMRIVRDGDVSHSSASLCPSLCALVI